MPDPSNKPESPNNTQLALERTWLAHERTLMAWVRTATSMISFGFSIYKFFEFEKGRNGAHVEGILTPRDFALIIVSVGLFALLIAGLQHYRQTRELKASMTVVPRSIAEIVAVLISIFGLLVLLTAAYRG
jgi:putative membrane protein